MAMKGLIRKYAPFSNFEWDIAPGIIYLVGKNAAGKTRLIQSIKDGHFALMTGALGRERPTVYGYTDWNDFTYNHKNETQKDFKTINENFARMGQQLLDEEEVNKKEKTSRNEEGKKVKSFSVETQHQINGTEFLGPEMKSKGTKFLFDKLNWELTGFKRLDKWSTPHNRPQYGFVFIEEPENSLHPDIQKQIPAMFSEWYKKASKRRTEKLFLIVTTHSPFVLKGLEDGNQDIQHCYVLENTTGHLKRLPHKKAILKGNDLLGAGIGDLVPGRIIIAENSIAILLESIGENPNIDLPSFFVTSGGDGDTGKRISNIQSLQKLLKSLSKGYPDRFMLKLSYTIITDDIKARKRIEADLNKNSVEGIDVNVLNLGQKCLEDTYPIKWVRAFNKEAYPDKVSWDKKTDYGVYCRETLGLEGRAIGSHKQDLAIYISNKITDFSTLKTNLRKVHKVFEDWETL